VGLEGRGGHGELVGQREGLLKDEETNMSEYHLTGFISRVLPIREVGEGREFHMPMSYPRRLSPRRGSSQILTKTGIMRLSTAFSTP